MKTMKKSTTSKEKTPTSTRRKKTTSSTLTLPDNPFVFEVFDLVSRQRSKAKKVEVLKKYDHPSIRSICIWNFDESVTSVLPIGEVPYAGYDDQNTYNGTLSSKITQEVRTMHDTSSFSLGVTDKQGHTTVRREYGNFYHFIKGGNDSMSKIRREMMFINILEGLHPLESEILCLVKDKKLEEKYKITKEVVSEAYSSITWGGRS